ncbi:hypothetical protein [Kosakonia sacchari]|uniref:hypothetical protein n=1 Tax=Kosakonia sacchari TaxID=1158459 RepID=UPI0008074F32|nr:hypothetical protein [Kosakonia sacchari]ANR80268.1 hypothetical protein BBB57_19665 [Kosakonia sacchari]NUL38199.1 hypothetical protein [Kosakonia sacchari]
MSKKIMQEYLVLGGKHHGEVWRGVYPAMGLNLSKHDERYGQFFDREGQQKIELSRKEQYFISEWVSPQGQTFLLATAEDLTEFDIEEEIERITPPLRPLDGAVEDWI